MTIRVGIGGQRSNVEFLRQVFAATETEITLVHLPSRLGHIPWWRIPSRIWRDLDGIDLYYGIYYGQWLRYLLAKLRGRGTICHWVGSDALALTRQPRWRHWPTRLIDRHLAVSPNLVDELAAIGIAASNAPLTSQLYDGPVPSLPAKFTVLAYLPIGRDELYGADVVYSLARRHPSWRIWIVGRGPTPDGRTLKNVSEFGADAAMAGIYPQTTLLMRPTRHDGLPRMVLEALSWGRYVVCSTPLPHCATGQSLTEVNDALQDFAERSKPNFSGSEYVRATYGSDAIVATLSRHLREVAEKHHA